MAIDPHLAGRIDKDHGSALLAHQLCNGFVFAGIAAQNAVTSEEPQIPELADTRPRRQLGDSIGRIVDLLGHLVERSDPQVDLGDFEAGQFDAEVEVEQRQFLELLR